MRRIWSFLQAPEQAHGAGAESWPPQKRTRGCLLFDPCRDRDDPGPAGEGQLRTDTEASLRADLREIFSTSRLLQYNLQVAYLGPEWTNSHLAALSAAVRPFLQVSPFTFPRRRFRRSAEGKGSCCRSFPSPIPFREGLGHTLDLLYEREVRVVPRMLP